MRDCESPLKASPESWGSSLYCFHRGFLFFYWRSPKRPSKDGSLLDVKTKHQNKHMKKSSWSRLFMAIRYTSLYIKSYPFFGNSFHMHMEVCLLLMIHLFMLSSVMGKLVAERWDAKMLNAKEKKKKKNIWKEDWSRVGDNKGGSVFTLFPFHA